MDRRYSARNQAPAGFGERIVDAEWAFRRYEEIRERLPSAQFPAESRPQAHLGELLGRFDVFVFDAFGVLNVGATAIPGACARIAALRRAGKRLIVLTNGATTPLVDLPQKYADFGFDFVAAEIVSSRAILADALARRGGLTWGIVAPSKARISELPGACVLLNAGGAIPETVDAFVLLSSQVPNPRIFSTLTSALDVRPRPLLVGNPDLVAPQEKGFSLEPGSYAHDLADATGIVPEFFGKPFADAFDEIRRRLGPDIRSERIAMVGDTLHTDILGGAAAGFGTVLVTATGVLRDLNVGECIAASGIVPDYIIPYI